MLIWLEIDGTGLGWFYSIDQGHPFSQKGHMWLQNGSGSSHILADWMAEAPCRESSRPFSENQPTPLPKTLGVSSESHKHVGLSPNRGAQ